MFKVREPTSMFFMFWQSYGKAKLAKRMVMYPSLNPKNFDVEQLTLNANSNIFNRAIIVYPYREARLGKAEFKALFVRK